MPKHHRAAGPAGSVTTTALKEWSAAVHALLDGRQTVLLRKGGIHEKRFSLDPGRSGFLLFPTVAHSHTERLRPEHHDLVGAATDSTEDLVVLRAGAKVIAAVEVTRPEAMAEITDLHIWTEDSVRADRLDFRPRHRLTVLVVQARPLTESVRLPRSPDYAGCSSWVQLPIPETFYAAPVHDIDTLTAVAQRVRDSVG